MKNPWVVIGIIAIALFGGAIWFSGSAAEQNNEGVVVAPHIKGNPEAVVELVEYSDFQCPACAAFQPILTTVLEEYGDELRFEYRHFPLLNIHPHAQAAAVAAEAAGQQGKFFEFHDLLFENQTEWAAAAVPTSFFLQYAEALDLDIEMFRRHLNASVLQETVRTGFTEARALELTGTPSFLLNGQKMTFDSYESFVAQIATAIDPSVGSSTPAAAEGDVRFGI